VYLVFLKMGFFMSFIGKLFAALVGGFVVSLLGSVVVATAMANSDQNPDTSSTILLVFFAISAALALSAKRAAKAWRRLLLLSAVLCFAMPLASMIFSGVATAEMASHSGAAAAGAMLGGGIVTMVTGVFGFFLGAIFLIAGLLVGRDPKIIIVNSEVKTVSEQT